METLADLVEAPTDWLAEIPDGRTQVIAKLIVDEQDPVAWLTRLVGDTADLQIVNGPVGDLPPGNEPDRQRELRDALLNEVHDFLCGAQSIQKNANKFWMNIVLDNSWSLPTLPLPSLHTSAAALNS
jgi:hypothetical protein